MEACNPPNERSASFEIGAMRKQTAMAETGTEQRSASQDTEGCYVYAIIDDGGDQGVLDNVGVDGGRVYRLGDGRHAAVVSDIPNRRIRPERRRVAAHHEVLKRLMAAHSVLPMSFGMIADDPDVVRRILGVNRAAFAAQLRRVRGKVEMGTRVTWDKSNIYEYFISKDTDLKTYRDRLFRGGREPSREEMIALGRLFDNVLGAARAEVTDKVTRQMQAHCAELVVDPPRNEREALNLACLVDRDRQKEFEHGVIESAALFDDDIAFDINGPWPPHHFVDIQLKY
jgi:Gas vesicle synthesis protein GvpL/GvpF